MITSKESSYQSDLLEARRNADEAVKVGRETLQQLGRQNETLNSAEDTLEANEYVLHKSMRLLRGMTWSGSIYNLINGNPLPTSKTSTKDAQTQSNTQDDRNDGLFQSTTSMPSNHNIDTRALLLMKSSSASSTQQTMSIINEDLELHEISRSVNELQNIAVTMGDELDKQNGTLDRIDTKLGKVHDDTLQCTLKSSQIANQIRRVLPIYHVGRFQFKYIKSDSNITNKNLSTSLQYFLAVDLEGNLILSTSDTPRSTYFDCFTKGDGKNIYALQNTKTQTFLSVTLFGTIKMFGRNFTQNEELFLEINHGNNILEEAKITGILLLRSNWGGGGWLLELTSVVENTIDTVCFNKVSSSITDKKDIAQFIPILYSPPPTDTTAITNVNKITSSSTNS